MTEFKEIETLAEVDEMVDEGKKVMLYYHAEWCGPCREASEDLEGMEFDDDIVLLKFDTDKDNRGCMSRFVRSIPTIVFYKDKDVAFTQVGLANPKELYEHALSIFK